MAEIVYCTVILGTIALFCSKKFLKILLTSIGVLAYCYALISIYIHYCAVADILEYLQSRHEEICSLDFSLESLPLPTSSWDMRISYSFVYNEHGERLTVIYHYRKTRSIMCVK